MGVITLASILDQGVDEVGNSSTSDGSAGESSSLTSAMTMARLLLLVKENQLATAVILFAAWQAGLFVEAWMTIQGMCAV